ncbi:MAG: PaaI family thioesterase [Alphaproteobacteria bacterium]|nr:MAG: PaaI family thioesterase [Alphaproteobacteria bacterium]
MTGFRPRDPGWEARVAGSFARQSAMRSIGASIARLEPGAVDLRLQTDPAAMGQQHGFIHAGVITAAMDSACGYAALGLMEAGSEVLTVEFKASFLAPARGRRFLCRGRVLRPGRTLTFCTAEALALGEGQGGDDAAAGAGTPIATMTATMIRVVPR